MLFVLFSFNTKEGKMKIIPGRGTAVLSVKKEILSRSIKIYNTATMVFQDKNRLIGALALVLSGILVLTFTNLVSIVTEFIRNYLSSDHILKDVTKLDIKHYVAYFVILLGAIGLFLIFRLDRKCREIAVSYIDFDKAALFFYTDNESSSKQLSFYLFWIASLTSVLLIMLFAAIGDPPQEGLLEAVEAFLLIASSLIMLFTGMKAPRKTAYIFYLFALVLFLMFGEEISWGQRIFGFGTTEFFKENNYQAEMNLHNFFNPVYDLLYKTFGIIFFVVLVLFWLFMKERKNSFVRMFLPPRSLSLLIFLAVCSTFGNREFFETLFYIFIFLYSIRMYFCVRYPASGRVLSAE